MEQILSYFLHLDTHLSSLITTYHTWVYLILFIILFCETGLIITPFLPGDSLLFALGSIAAQDTNSLNPTYFILLLILASFLGNQVNYLAGRWMGPRIFNKDSWLFNKKYLERAQIFYLNNGGKTILLARFMPIIRTFAPFVAGVGRMSVSQFILYNLLSAVLWISSLIGLGYFLGKIPLIKDNFSLVIYGIIILTLLPACFTFFYDKAKPVS